MQVFGLPGHIIRAGKLASRIAAQSPSNEAAIRRTTLARWRQAMADGLTAERAATALGVPLSTLYRWQKQSVAQCADERPGRPRDRMSRDAIDTSVSPTMSVIPLSVQPASQLGQHRRSQRASALCKVHAVGCA